MIATSAASLRATTKDQSFPHVAYRADIDGLRAVAVMAVVIHHIAPELLHGGFVGVDVFFVISGFLITKIIHTEMREQRFSFLEFYARRARRILPALLAVVVATLAAGWLLQLPSDYRATLRSAVAAVFSVSNILFSTTTKGYFDETDERLNPLLHTWSLGVEEQFYLFFPFALLVWMRLPRSLRVAALLVAGVISLAAAQALVQRYPDYVFYLLPFRAWEFMVGGALAIGLVPAPKRAVMRSLLVACGLAAIAWSCLYLSAATPFPGLAALLPVCGAAAVIHAGSGGAISGLGRVLAWRPVVFVGLVSYSLYLWHWPVLVLADYTALLPSGAAGGAIVFGMSFALAVLSYQFVERPFRAKQPQRLPVRLALALSLVGAVSLAAAAGEQTRGFSGRFAPDVVRLDAARTALGEWRPCFNKPFASACTIGASDAPPDALLWGDSHALSWAPAVHAELQKIDRSAFMVSVAGCPPLLDIRNQINPGCAAHNAEVLAELRADPALRTVVLAGYWNTYFRPNGPIEYRGGRTRAPAGPLDGVEAASVALRRTVRQLTELGIEVIVIGPVPVYPRSVPTVVALERLLRRPLLDRSAAPQQEKHAAFFSALAGLEGQPRVRVVRPLDWLCVDGECKVVDGAESMYRDAHHLSVHGAQYLAARLGPALAR
ncbi:acyltransferase family protein [Ramlibacter sp. AN1015]|uniref:acyltransferase family protein n=1 Tax=Ramlibacter sp. AN1015 TaxID=3133428 RepID=UPI0030C40B32